MSKSARNVDNPTEIISTRTACPDPAGDFDALGCRKTAIAKVELGELLPGIVRFAAVEEVADLL